jgi:manganese/zinc/iron transport system ATP- binding protein
MNNVIEVKDLTITYGDNNAVLWKTNGSIPEKSLTAIVGPNGAGKSTLVKSIIGAIKPHKGEIKINNKSIKNFSNKHKLISYVPQRDTLDDNFPISCLDVVLMGRYGKLGWIKRPSKSDKDAAMNALEKFGMQMLANKQIGELSGGQKQRVLLARSYLQDSDIIILDEPFGGIDLKTEKIILDLLKELRDKGKTVLVITHDLDSLKDHFDYVWLLNIHTIAFGKPDQVLTKENLIHCYGGSVHLLQHEDN